MNSITLIDIWLFDILFILDLALVNYTFQRICSFQALRFIVINVFILFRIYNDFLLLILKICFFLFVISILKFLSISLTVGFCLFFFWLDNPVAEL